METGFLYIDKPAGISSFKVIDILRKITGIKRIGHAGTLDPFATGLLIVAVGRESTKLLTRWLKTDKEYEAVMKLGYDSTTGDTEGDLTLVDNVITPTEQELKDVMNLFKGEIEQIPPQFSALKVNGVKAYHLARQGIKVDLKSRTVNIYEIDLLKYNYPQVSFKVKVSCGTYIRTLAQDIGKTLKVGGYLIQLRRIKVDNVSIDQAVKINEITSENWQNFLKN